MTDERCPICGETIEPLEDYAEHSKINRVVIQALLYETAWNRWSNPSQSPELTEAERLLEKGKAHQALLDAVRQLRGPIA